MRDRSPLARLLRRRAPAAAAAMALLGISACGATSTATSPTASPSTTGAVPPAPTPATGAAPWPAPPAARVLGLVAAAGLTAETAESLQHHVHAHLDVFVNGTAEAVPAGIGIVISDPGVHRFDLGGGKVAYGGISPPCAQPCISPLHTHDSTGILHTESATNTDNTLGQLFSEWDVPLTAQCVGGYCAPQATIAVYLDGHSTPFSGAASVRLTDHLEIAIVIGTPPSHIPSTADFSAA